MDTQFQKSLQEGKEENTSIAYFLSKIPIAVEDTPDTREVADYLLPFGIGIEFECFKGENYDIDKFTSIPGVIDVDVDDCEQRYRIVSGFDGLKALYRLSLTLREYSLLNLDSGLHYHIGLNDYYDSFVDNLTDSTIDYILSELDKWDYKGSYNRRQVSTNMGWVRLQSRFKTAEVRIGEMTFDYPLLFERITHACKIFMTAIEGMEYLLLRDRYLFLKYEEQDVNSIIKNRVKTIKPHVRND